LGFLALFYDQISLTKDKEKHNILCKKNMQALYQGKFPYDKPIICVISVDKTTEALEKVWKKSLKISALM